MSRRQALSRYNLIIKKLRKQPLSFQEISDYLDYESELQDENLCISTRTFQRDVKDIFNLYRIDIQFDRSRKVYYIDSDTQPEINERIAEAFDTFQAFNLTSRLSEHIHFEKRKPKGTENLHGLLHAIKNGLQINFTYQKYWADALTERTVQPYALKEFKNRWYVLAKDFKDQQVKVFALDRLSDLEITKIKFVTPEGFDVADYYRHCFGIMSANAARPEEVILSFDTFQGQYIKSLPLHNSQEILVDNDSEIRVKLNLFITHDFVMELLSHGASVKVLQPQSLIEELKSVYQAALDTYAPPRIK